MKRSSDQPHDEQQQLYRQMLLDKRAEVLASLGIKFDTRATLGRVAEEDQAQISHDEFISLHRNSLDYQQWRLVEEALDRLRSGEYGVCVGCEERIPAKRLQAVPWAKYCIRCQDEMTATPQNAPPGEALRPFTPPHW